MKLVFNTFLDSPWMNSGLMCFCRNEMNVQVEEIESMYEKRMEIYRKSVKKDNRKRRRCDGMWPHV